jgi:predicted DNA-binding antitoxin AbrB/MazE fold protein
MSRHVEAIYENGVLRPLEPLILQEKQRVTVLINESVSSLDRAYQDISYAAESEQEQQAYGRVPSIEEILQLTGRDTSSWAEAVSQEREERF